MSILPRVLFVARRDDRRKSGLLSFSKDLLQRQLKKAFPLVYEIMFTPGNLDESLRALVSGHRRIVRLMKQPGLRTLATAFPDVVYRPYRRYLATSFTKSMRRAALEEHYGTLRSRVSEAFFSEILRNELMVWRKTIAADEFSIVLSFTGELHHEGDLLLELRQNSVPLYHLSFTIAPGYLTGSLAAQVILVGRVQGVPGQFDAIRRATKTCLDVAPPYLLIAAVQGIAVALSIASIAGVRNIEQITRNIDAGRIVHFDYDAFWRTLLGEETDKFYLLPVPIPEKPIALISSVHRRRTRGKRQFKAEITDASKTLFRGLLTHS